MSKKKLVSWDQRDSVRKHHQFSFPKYTPNGLECPKCKKELYDDQSITLTSNPPQTPVLCLGDQCDFRSSRF